MIKIGRHKRNARSARRFIGECGLAQASINLEGARGKKTIQDGATVVKFAHVLLDDDSVATRGIFALSIAEEKHGAKGQCALAFAYRGLRDSVVKRRREAKQPDCVENSDACCCVTLHDRFDWTDRLFDSSGFKSCDRLERSYFSRLDAV